MRNRKSGIAVVIVLVLTTMLLALAGAYIQQSRQSIPINSKLLERVQADFWGQGVAQLALLKFKQLPSEFYYAYNFSVRDSRVAIPDPWSNFLLAPLQGHIDSPLSLDFSTTCKVLGQTKYKTDSIQFEVVLEGQGLKRNIKQTISSVRVKN